MRILTSNEIARTAFNYVSPEGISSPYGYKYPKKDKNETCPYCKNEDTEIINDAAYLKPFKEFYKNKPHKVVYCSCCEAIFSFHNAGIIK